VSALAIALAGCSDSTTTGTDGAPGAPGSPGTSGDTTIIVAPGGVASPADATALTVTVTGVTISSPPVVEFSVANQDGVPVAGFGDSDLRFNISKLIPASQAGPSKWQNYINRVNGGYTQGYQERASTGGTLVDNLDGTFVYTFATDITSAAANPCPGPCTEADGVAPLDISYQPNLTHRVTIQQGNRDYPLVNAAYDFVPAGGPVTSAREIVKTETCNECHNQLALHGGTRIEIKLCVSCHNPGTTRLGKLGTVTGPQTVDFKVMIHKIHMGEHLPSVEAGGDYGINGYSGSLISFKDVVFPQDIRNCTKCHDGAVTAQGNNWQTQPSVAACGSCHDDINFSMDRSVDPNGHSGGDVSGVTDSNDCLACHSSGEEAGSIAEKHSLPALLKAEGAKYKLKIVSVTDTAPLSTPTIRFSITNAADTPYDIAATPAITGGSMGLYLGWNTTDITNTTPTVGRNNAQPISISLLSGGALAGSVTDNGDGTYSVTSTTAVPADATGSGRIGFQARMSVDVDGDATADRVQVKSVVKDFIITGSSVVARRTAVEIAKCNQCHDRVSLHGGSRTDEPQICVMCHNPNATDTARRPAGAPTGTLDNKAEESIDFKRLIHGIHASAETHYDGSAGHGFREKGLVVYGYGGSVHDFGHVRFPGILKDCASCHTSSSYQLSGVWASPTQSGILGSTIDHGADLADAADDLNISPTAAVCSSCHDGTLAQTHMTWGTGSFDATDATVNSNLETCSICHGPGAIADVKTVHGVQ
jgi:OmcA/MtrC family decaheme c-type cytochrome